jgi:hypothetical protein
MVEGPFSRLFPSRLEPMELGHKLERVMENNILLQGEGRRLAPNAYDIYVSIRDHQRLSLDLQTLIPDWQKQLIEFARHRHYTLRTEPTLRLHADSSLAIGSVRIEVGGIAQGNIMTTQELSAEQIAQLRSRIPTASQLPDSTVRDSLPNQPHALPNAPAHAARHTGPSPSSPAMPQAWLTIRLPQAAPQMYHIEKPVVNIGRQLSNDIIVEDKRVSRYHAQIKYQPDDQFVIYDLGSTNGITINNTPQMRQHTLRTGDRFTIGSYDFYFERR